MTDKEKKEIIQTLKYHIEAEDCVTCEAFGKCNEFLLTKKVLDLINLQQAEIERLKSDLSIWKDVAHRETSYVEIAKSEAIKEFAERLKSIGKQDGAYDYVSLCDIDNIVKEMVGETE